MGSLKLEGDLNQMDQVQQSYIMRHLEELGYKENKVTVNPVGKVGDNYIANVKRIVVEKEDGTTFKMIAKIAPQNKISREMMITAVLFRNEVVIYGNLFTKFTELEQKAGVPKEERFPRPACYGALNEEPHEVILLEDMGETGFVMKDKMSVLDDVSIKIVLKSFAQMHALSYALKEQDPEEFNAYKTNLQFIWEEFIQKPEYNIMFEPFEQQILSILDDENKEKYKGYFVNMPIESVALFKEDIDCKQSVVLQGDSWVTNFLFRIEEGKTIDCVMIDYQLSRIGIPAVDLLYMIFSCTDYESKKAHFHEWLDYYHAELEKCLSYHGVNIQDVLTRDQLDKDIKRYAKTMVLQSIFIFMITLRGETEVKDIKSEFESKTIDELQEEMNISHLKLETLQKISKRIKETFVVATELELV